MEASMNARMCDLFHYLRQGDYVFSSVDLFVCYERTVMKFYGGVQDGKRNKWSNFDGNPYHYADCIIRNQIIIQQIMSRFRWNFQDSFAMIV